MTMTAKVILSCIGVFIGGSGMYWQMHAKDPLDATFWVGIMFAGLIPLGTYFVGLAQRAPWDTPTLPTSTVETKSVVTDPPPVAAPAVVSETTTKKAGG